MRVLAAPAFTTKVQSLPATERSAISQFLAHLEAISKESLLAGGGRAVVTATAADVYVAPAGRNRIFMSFGRDTTGDYAVLLDVFPYHAPLATSADGPSLRNPRTNGRLNPTINGAINPFVNGTLNPLVNGSLNPFVNGRINPSINGSINPLINGVVNPAINGRINPTINGSLNPQINPTVNPRINHSYKGPYLYDLALTNVGFVVEANPSIILLFDANLAWVGHGVRNSVDGYALFDRNSSWIGHLVPDRQGGFLRFDTNNQWIGLAV